MTKYLILFITAFVLEIGSTLYIRLVSEGSVAMIVLAFIGPLLQLPFVHYAIQESTFIGRLRNTLVMGAGYGLASALIYFTL